MNGERDLGLDALNAVEDLTRRVEKLERDVAALSALHPPRNVVATPEEMRRQAGGE